VNHRTTLIEMTNQLIMALQPQRCFDTVAGMPPALLDFSGYSEASSFFGSLQSVSTTVLPSAGPFATAAAPETDIGGSNYVTIPPLSGSSLAEYFSDTAETDQISFSKDWLCGFQRYHKAVVKHLDEDPHEVLSRLTLGNSLASGDPLNCTEREENQARLTKVSRDVEKGFDNLKLRTDMLLLDQSLYFEMINKATAEPVDSVSSAVVSEILEEAHTGISSNSAYISCGSDEEDTLPREEFEDDLTDDCSTLSQETLTIPAKETSWLNWTKDWTDKWGI